MSQIILTTLNAKYIHSSFGLRYLHANLGPLQSQAKIIEFEISRRPQDIVEELLSYSPKIIGFGVYIWNTHQIREVLLLLTVLAPHITIVLGGPEISYNTEEQEIFQLCNYVITGEADLQFQPLCSKILSGDLPEEKIISSPIPDVTTIALPYELYTDDDIANRVIYVEASRGCPFTCEFCLSSLDVPVRQFDTTKFLSSMEMLLEKGLRQFKFVDRTFNLHLKTSKAILEFFLTRFTPGLFVHFEMVPDRLPDSLRDIIKQFPHGSLQFEVGIQSFNPEVGKLISRRQDFQKIEDNIRFLRAETGVHIHADLIVGLPGETLESFGEGFNRLVELDPQEIQVGILKRLKGTPIIRHDADWEMKYSPHAPYELLENKLISFQNMQRLNRFSRYWDLVANSGNFTSSKTLLWKSTTPFDGFMAWSDWLYKKTGTRHSFSLKALAEYLHEYCVECLPALEDAMRGALRDDFLRLGRSDLPGFLKDGVQKVVVLQSKNALPKRQSKFV